MEQFVVSARKYRPAIFESVVGQKHITTTLKNSISSNHLPQAFFILWTKRCWKNYLRQNFSKNN